MTEKLKKMILSFAPANLKKQLKTEKGTIEEGIVYVVLSLLIFIVIFAVSLFINQDLFESFGINNHPRINEPLTIIMFILVLISAPIIFILSFVVFLLGITAVMYALARLLGGTGSFANQFYHFAILDGGLTIISSLFYLVPSIGKYLSFLPLIYFIYPVYLIYRQVHNLSKIKSIFLALLTIIVETIGAIIVLFITFSIIAMFFYLILGD